MNPAFVIAEQMIVDRLISNKAPVTGESKLRFILITFSGVMGGLFLGFMFCATYLWLDDNFSPIVTMLGMGAFAAILSVLGIVITLVISSYKRKKIKQVKGDIIRMAEDAIEVFNGELSESIKNNPKTSVLITSFAGFLVGDKVL